ncbi:Gas vesicle synthesis protein GvpL/GvpF [Saccharopolyspora kobensis]|uniref:Gas vesicle synthesis protein GvpL/GvpF n=1 Tax=Saccharopolyspora kobensis TaxID=146035 RepID=A0A1H6AF29_9PSEU|nr:GvpL/GvpF family gas vesicle protein [Saccharopolyspora kobensis]SEG46346.1 Gas vesicle synthesis protein GvpL/GvpF [Saccharopolyspora kobensis]SFE54462.1 Gas vesicle synthesis protein GvpL/GvpF [Saccharopolyspora kobensis]
MADSMTYVYGIVRDPGPEPTLGAQGIAGSAVRLVRQGELAALVSSVDAAEFDAEALRKNLEDLEWLEATARAHNRVVLAAAATTTTAPFGLATVYFHDDRVREVLAERAEEFSQVLHSIDDSAEWGVKARADLDDPALRRGTGEAGAEAAAGPGASYLRQLKEQRESRQNAENTALELAGQVHAELCSLARASRSHPPQNRELAGYAGLMVLNCSYLVDKSAGDEFTATVRRLSDDYQALDVELTGPWPPYSFAQIREGENR